MRIQRNSTTVPNATLRAVLAFVRPPGVAGFTINLRNARADLRGRAYPDSGHVVLAVGSLERFPTLGRKQSGAYLGVPPLGNRTEALVFIAAHELRHLWQQRVPRGRRVHGARGQFSERDADAYAYRMLRRYRREGIAGVERGAPPTFLACSQTWSRSARPVARPLVVDPRVGESSVFLSLSAGQTTTRTTAARALQARRYARVVQLTEKWEKRERVAKARLRALAKKRRYYERLGFMAGHGVEDQPAGGRRAVDRASQSTNSTRVVGV